MLGNTGEWLTIWSLAWSCFGTLLDDTFSYCLSQFEYARFVLFLLFVFLLAFVIYS